MGDSLNAPLKRSMRPDPYGKKGIVMLARFFIWEQNWGGNRSGWRSFRNPTFKIGLPVMPGVDVAGR